MKISLALLELAAAAETVLFATAKGKLAMKNPKIDHAQRCLLERIDGFRSIEQLLAMSGDLIGVHSALGKLMESGCVSTDARPQAEMAGAVFDAAPDSVAPAAPARSTIGATVAGPATASSELDNAKRVLAQEAKLVFGKNAAKLQPRIDGCRTIEEIYDLIVKFQQHLASTGKANPDVFLDRLTKGLATARKQVPAGQRPGV